MHRLRTRPLTPSIVQSREICREANAAMEQGDWQEAEKKLAKAMRLNPKDADIRRHYAEVLWQLGQQQESIRQLNEASKLSRKETREDPAISISLAEKMLNTQQIEQADHFSRRATELGPKESKAWALHGKVQSILGEEQSRSGGRERAIPFYEKAMFDYYRALSLTAPGSLQNRELLVELAGVQMRMGQAERALATWQSLERLYLPSPRPVLVLRGKAETLVALNRIEDAIEMFNLAIEQAPNDLDLLMPLADLQLRNGQIAEAALTTNRIRSLAPNHPFAIALAQQIEAMRRGRPPRM